MRFKLENKRLDIYIDLKNNGRFRFKTRKSPNEFGNSFATKTNKINNEVYLEWQIGYDIKVTDTNKNTILKNLKFTGANGKNKYPYELSELLYSLMTLNLITKKQLIDLVTEIKKYNDFIGNKKIKISKNLTSICIEGISFNETSIELPTLFFKENDNTQIEISIQKQQYATGVQPMVYFCIPITSFQNYKNFIGKESKNGDELIYSIDNNNCNVLIDLFKVFGLCSKSHKHDVIEILKKLSK